MATKNQDVELRIRATNLSKKTTDEVISSLEELTQAQNDNIEAAKKGTASAKALEDGYSKLETAAKALVSQSALTKTFEAQSAALADAGTRLEAARKAQQDFTNGIDASATATKAQQKQLNDLNKAVEAAERAFTRVQDRVGNTSDKLAKFGISSENISESQNKISQAITNANSALERQEQAIIGLDAAAARHLAELAVQAAAEKQRAADIAFTNAQRVAAEQSLLVAEQKRAAASAQQEAETERELNVDRLFLKAQQDITAELNRQTEARQAQRNAILAAASAADAAARSTSVTARGTTPAATPQLANQIRDINDPAAAALKSVDGLEASVGKLEDRVRAINGPVKDYKGALNDATAAQKALVAVAGQIDTFNQQTAAVKAARVEYNAASAATKDLIAQLRAGAGGDDIIAKLARSQATLQKSAQNLGDLSTQARASQAALKAAGVDTSNLASAEEQLVQQANRAQSALNSLTEAYNKHGAAVDDSRKKNESWFGGGRTTLSFFQRLRGEVLGLAAAYIGLNAAIDGAGSVLETFSKSATLQSRLLIANGGNAQQAADDYSFLEQAAAKYGFRLLDVGKSYAAFAIATKSANFSTQQTKFVFEQLSIAAHNAGLSTEDFGGILLAFQQIVSKGKLSAEEFNQLGERLPGVFQIAASKLGLTTQELAKSIEQNKRNVLDVITIAGGIGETFGKIDGAANSLRDAQAGFQNAMDKFQLAIAKGGFADAFTEFLNKLTSLIGSDQGAKLAQTLAGGFNAVITILTLVADNIDGITLALKILLALKVAQWAVGFTQSAFNLRGELLLLKTEITGIAGAFGLMSTGAVAAEGTLVTATATAGRFGVAITALGVGLRILTRFLGIVGVLITAFEIGKFAFDKFFNKDDAENAAGEAGKAAKKGLNKQLIADPGKPDVSQAELDKVKAESEKEQTKLEQEGRDIRRAGFKKDLASRLQLIDQDFQARRDAANKDISDAAKREEALKLIQKDSLLAQANERQRFNNEQASQGESAAKKLQADTVSAVTALDKAFAEMAKRKADADPALGINDRAKANLDAVVQQYGEIQNTINKIAKTDKPRAQALQGILDGLIAQRQAEESNNTVRADAARLEKNLNDLVSERKSRQQELQTLLDSGQITQSEFTQRSIELSNELNPKIQQAGHTALDFANSVGKLLDPSKLAASSAAINASLATANTIAVNNALSVDDAQKQVNSTLAERQRLYDQIALKEKLGILTADQANIANNNVTASFKDALTQQVENLLNLITTARDATGANKEALAQQQAAADALLLTLKNSKAATKGLGDTVINSLTNNAVTGFETLAGSIAKVAQGQESLGQGFRDAAAAATTFFAGILRDIAAYIIKAQILAAIETSKGEGGLLGSFINLFTATAHTGGVIGQRASSSGKFVNPGIFAGAQRLHSGGIPGLKPNEVPTILEKNEEVLTRDDPRHILNGGGAQQGGGSNRFVLVDDRSKVAEAMASSEGERVTMVHLRRNIPTIKQLLK